jgi:hypothetical protein
MKGPIPPAPNEGTPDDATTREPGEKAHDRRRSDDKTPNPPHTTTGPITAPKFGSAGSGGAELEPGPPRP